MHGRKRPVDPIFKMKAPDFQVLEQALLFFHVKELEELLFKYNLSVKGKKRVLIGRLLHFLKTGEKLLTRPLPANVCAKRGELYSLHPHALILKGSYKNDLKTRLFFKDLVGEHFHFTAFGLDWIQERWEKGIPPTYEAFAKMWQKEYERRQQVGSLPKEEWAYIRFVQSFIKQFPKASKSKILEAWEEERTKQVALAHYLLKNIEK